MKFSWLRLILAISIFSLGTNCIAATEDAQAIETELGAELDSVGDATGALCTLLTKLKVCSTCNSMDDVKTCFANAKGSTLTQICDKGCNRVVCKVPTLQSYCMNYCCPDNSNKITSCLSQNGGKKCP